MTNVFSVAQQGFRPASGVFSILKTCRTRLSSKVGLFLGLMVTTAGLVQGQEVLTFNTSNATATEDKLLTINQIGGGPVILANSSSFTGTPGKMAVDRATRRIYVMDQLTGGGGVFRFNADGTGKTTIYTNTTAGSQCLGIAVDSVHGILYIITSNATASEDKLIKCGMDGSNPTVLVSGASFTAFPGACSVDEVNQKIYVCDILSGGGGVFRYDADGSNKTTIYANSTAGSQTFSVAVDSTRGIVYIITSNATAAQDKLIKTDLTGGSPTVLVSGASLTTFPNQVAVDVSANRIYVTDSQTAGGGIFRFDSAGGSRTQVFTNSTSGSTMIGIALSSATASTISSLNRVNPTPTSATTVNWTATFAHTVYGVSAANFSLTGTATSGATVGAPTTTNAGFNWNIPVTTPTSSGTLQLNLANSIGMSASISTSLPFSGQSYSLVTPDTTPPTVTIGSPTLTATKVGPVSFTVTYADANLSTVTLASNNVVVNTTGTASVGSVTVTGTGATRTVQLGSLTGNGTVGISLPAGTAVDTAGNLAVAAGPSATCSMDNLGPVVTISSPSVIITKNGPVVFTVNFADEHFSSSSLLANFSLLTKTGTASAGSISVGGSVASNRVVTISALTGDGTITLTIPTNAASDTLGNKSMATGPGPVVIVDHTAPAISISAPSVSSTTNGPISFTVTYSDANFNSITLQNTDIGVNGTGTAAAAGITVTGSGLTRTVTLDTITGNGSLSISLPAGTATDLAGNSASLSGPSAAVLVDNAAPDISISAPSVSSTTHGPVTYTVIYTDPNFSSSTLQSSDIIVNGTGTAAASSVVVTGSGTNFTVSLSGITGDGALGISLPAGTATDTGGYSSAAAGPGATVTVDNTAPTIVIGSPSVSSTRSGPVDFVITYNGQNSISLLTNDIVVNKTGSAVVNAVSVSGSGNTRTVTLSDISGDGTVGISLPAATASDTMGNTALAAGPSATFTVDNTAPTVVIGSPSASSASTGPVTYTVTYSDTAFNAATLANADVTLHSTGSASGTVSVSGSGATRTVTISAITGTGTLRISIAAGTASDSVGNSAISAGPSATFSVAPADSTPPTLLIGSPSAATTASGPITYAVTYADENFHSSTLTGADITLNTTGTASASVAVSGSGLVRTVTLSGITGNGTLGISIAAGTATDTLGNSAAASGASATFTVNNLAPTVTVGNPSTNVTTIGPVTYLVTYGGDFDSSTLSTEDITLNATGTADAEMDVTGSGSTRLVTISNISGSGSLGISLASGTARNSIGNLAPASGPSATFVVDTTPTLAGIVAGQTTNDHATLMPFSAVIVSDSDLPAQTLGLTVALDDAAKGAFTGASLLASGFTNATGGVYGFRGTASAATTALQTLVFVPTAGRVASGMTETTTLTIVVGDDWFSATNALTTVVASRLNHSPTAPDLNFQKGSVSLKFARSKLFAGASDADDDAVHLSAIDTVSAAGGTIVSNGAWYIYSTPAGSPATDTFTYTLADDFGGSRVVTVHITLQLQSPDPASNLLRVRALPGGGVQITFVVIASRTYSVEATDSLTPAAWSRIATATADPLGVIRYDDLDTASHPIRFYRTTQFTAE